MRVASITALVALSGLAGLVPANAQDFSTSILKPTALAADQGVVAGTLPGGTGSKSYYLSADLQKGELATQLKIADDVDSSKSLTFEILGADARAKDSYYIMTSNEPKQEGTRTFTIESAGRYNLRVVAEGPETANFCVLLGGSALPKVQSPECPGAVKPAAAPPPPPVIEKKVVAPPPPPVQHKSVEVITTQCEQRLRVGSEVLFDFDKASIRPDAASVLDVVAAHVEQNQKPVAIEGHTDAKGTDAYNLRLSQQRAQGVELELRRRIRSMPQIQSFGLGESQPVAANELPDGSDYPHGRQLNRRVEIVINTCA